MSILIQKCNVHVGGTLQIVPFFYPDLSEYSSCVGNADLQEAFNICFKDFKEDYDVVMGDSTLSTDELKKSVCR